MKNLIWKYVANILILIILQAMLFNFAVINIADWLFIPYVYLLGIMILPFETQEQWLLITGFIVGLIIDLLSATLALHTAATVFIAYMRKTILGWIAPRLGYSQGTLPSYQFYGLNWAIKYALIISFLHHFVLYLLDFFSLKMIFFVAIKAAINAIYSTIFIIFIHYFIIKNRPVIV